MIPANELRIGNFVMVPCVQDYVIEVRNIYSDGINGSYNNLSEDEDIEATFEDIEPIPLMPELLEKCGFVKDHGGFSLPDKMSLSISVTKDNEFLPCWMDRTLYPGACRTVKSLHQLQNLYFALTGTELEIKP